MPRKKPIQYCSLTPEFPETAYLLFLFVMHQGEAVGMVPLEAIYPTINEASEAVENVLANLGETKHIAVPEEALLIPITFSALFPMREEFWKKPALSYDQQMRVRAFTPVAQYPTMYSLLVTPYVFDDETKEWYFNATLPMLEANHVHTIEQFMFKSDQVVEPRAKYSAIYTIGQKKRFNWKTKELKDIEQSVDEVLGKIN